MNGDELATVRVDKHHTVRNMTLEEAIEVNVFRTGHVVLMTGDRTEISIWHPAWGCWKSKEYNALSDLMLPHDNLQLAAHGLSACGYLTGRFG